MGVFPEDIRDWLKAALFGFEIGQFRISLARILIGVVLFTALLFATRLVQRWLRENVLSTRTDPGIANSIDTAVGYAGIGVAALLSVSYAGFDVTNLAIVAGCALRRHRLRPAVDRQQLRLGLILLIERPIKVGDWIVVGNEQGNVRRISVRSTEIETFDRASLIVPNSELIAGRVLNWTHRNSMGRLVLKFNVCYSADARKAAAILLECARRNPAVMRTPAPKAVLEGLAEKWLEFSLRVYLADINEALDVQSELRISALESLRAAGIDIPGAQPSAAAPVAWPGSDAVEACRRRTRADGGRARGRCPPARAGPRQELTRASRRRGPRPTVRPLPASTPRGRYAVMAHPPPRAARSVPQDPRDRRAERTAMDPERDNGPPPGKFMAAMTAR